MFTNQKILNFLILLFCFNIFSSISQTNEDVPLNNLVINQIPKPITSVIFEDFSGNKIDLKDYYGKLIIVNFWATWCAPCKKEMPSLDNLQEEMGDENFQVIIVSVERTDFSKVDDFLKEINIKNLSNYHDPTTMVGKHINAKGLPITILFDKNGKEIGRYNGDFEWDSKEVIKFITKLKNS